MAKESKKFVCRCRTTKKFYSMERNQAEAVSYSDKLIKCKSPTDFALSQERRQKPSEVEDVNKVNGQNNGGCKCLRFEKKLKRNQLGGCLCTGDVRADDRASLQRVDQKTSLKSVSERVSSIYTDERDSSISGNDRASSRSVDGRALPPTQKSKESSHSLECSCIETISNKSSFTSSRNVDERASLRSADERTIPPTTNKSKESSPSLECTCVETTSSKSSTPSSSKVESIEDVKSYQEVPSIKPSYLVPSIKSSLEIIVPSSTCQCVQSITSRVSNVEPIEDIKSSEVVPSPSKQKFNEVRDEVSPEKNTSMYINKLKFLLHQENILTLSVQNLQEKENVLKECLKKLDDDSLLNELKDLDVLEVNEVVEVLKQRSERISENLGDAKVERRQLQMNIDSPLPGESEMLKRKRIEIEMEKLQMELPTKDKENGKEIETLKQRLEDINDSVKDLSLISQRLKEEMIVLSCKCDDIHSNVISKKCQGSFESENVVDDIPVNKLEKIGRKLSNLILEVEACENCCIPEDLIEIVKSIRDLVDMVHKYT